MDTKTVNLPVYIEFTMDERDLKILKEHKIFKTNDIRIDYLTPKTIEEIFNNSITTEYPKENIINMIKALKSSDESVVFMSADVFEKISDQNFLYTNEYYKIQASEIHYEFVGRIDNKDILIQRWCMLDYTEDSKFRTAIIPLPETQIEWENSQDRKARIVDIEKNTLSAETRKRIIELCEQYLYKLLNKEILIHNCNGKPMPSNSEKTVDLFLYSGRTKINKIIPPENLWDIKNHSRKPSFKSIGDRKLSFGDFDILEIDGTCIYIHFDIFDNVNLKTSYEIFKTILQKFIERFNPNKNINDSRKEQFIELFYNMKMKSKIKEKEDALKALIAKRKKLENEHGKLCFEIIEKKNDLEYGSKHMDDLTNALSLEHDRISGRFEGNINIKDHEINQNEIIVYTNMLYAKNKKTNKYHRIGELKITINSKRIIEAYNNPRKAPKPENVISWKNLTTDEIMPHFQGKEVCIGDYKLRFNNLIADGNISQLIFTAISFITLGVDPSDEWGSRIKNFPVVEGYNPETGEVK